MLIGHAPSGLMYPAYIGDVDHETPLHWGGMDEIDNLQLLCKSCHKAKTKYDMRGEIWPGPVLEVLNG